MTWPVSRVSVPAISGTCFAIKLGDLIAKHVPEIAGTETRDTGQVISQTAKQLEPRSADNFYYFAEMCVRVDGHTYPTATHLNYTLFHPVGVCALISPWNVPFMTSTWKVAPALARALDAAVFMIFSNNGERCTAGSRILVQKSIYAEFAEKFTERARHIAVGDPLDEK